MRANYTGIEVLRVFDGGYTMGKKLTAFGVALILIGAVLFVYFRPGNVDGGSSDSEKIHFSWAGIRTVQNGGPVYAYVLAIRVPVNQSSITVVDNPSGSGYVFIRRGELYYPKRPIFFENLSVENLSQQENVTVYYSSEDYLGLLGVGDNHLTVLSGSGGLHIPCDSSGFRANVTEPRGVVYIGNERVMEFSNSSLRIGNETAFGKPTQLLLSYVPCLSKGLGYSVTLVLPNGGVNVYTGVLKISCEMNPSRVTFAPGFNFTNVLVIHNYTTYMELKLGFSCPHPVTSSIVNSLYLWLVLIILGAVLVIVGLIKR